MTREEELKVNHLVILIYEQLKTKCYYFFFNQVIKLCLIPRAQGPLPLQLSTKMTTYRNVQHTPRGIIYQKIPVYSTYSCI